MLKVDKLSDFIKNTDKNKSSTFSAIRYLNHHMFFFEVEY